MSRIDQSILYDTKYALIGTRLCALTISVVSSTGNNVKIRVTSSSDPTILFNGFVALDVIQKLTERFNNIQNSHLQDQRLLITRIESLPKNDNCPFLLHIDPGSTSPSTSFQSEPIVIPLVRAPLEDVNSYLLQLYEKEKQSSTILLEECEKLKKEVELKNSEYEKLKLQWEFQEKEINLLQQLNESRLLKMKKTNRRKRRYLCNHNGSDCDDDCEITRDIDEEDEDEEDDDDDDAEGMDVLYNEKNIEQQNSDVRLMSSQVLIRQNDLISNQNIENYKKNGNIPSNSQNSIPNERDLMKQLGVIMRTPATSQTSPILEGISVKLEENFEKTALALSSSQEGLEQTEGRRQKDIVVGVAQYVICQLCPEKEQKSTELSNLKEMEAHLLEKHVDKEKKQCEACPSNEFKPYNLIQHMKIHTNSFYACKHCGKRGRKNYLRSHIRTHTGERPFRCDTCSRSFTDASTLRRHRLVHTGEKKFQCPVCGRAIARKDNVKVHIRSHGIHL